MFQCVHTIILAAFCSRVELPPSRLRNLQVPDWYGFPRRPNATSLRTKRDHRRVSRDIDLLLRRLVVGCAHNQGVMTSLHIPYVEPVLVKKDFFDRHSAE